MAEEEYNSVVEVRFAADVEAVEDKAAAEVVVSIHTLQDDPTVDANYRVVDKADSILKSVMVVSNPLHTVHGDYRRSCSSSVAAERERTTACDERAKQFECEDWAAAVVGIDTATGCRCCDIQTKGERWRTEDGFSDRSKELMVVDSDLDGVEREIA